MRIKVPQPTIEKPLTPIDYMVPLAECQTHREVAEYAEAVPATVRSDERFGRAVAARLDEIKSARKKRA